MKTRFMMSAALCALALALPSAVSAQSVEARTARAVVDRMPDGEASEFPVDVGEVVCWSLVTGAEGTSIQHVWIHDGMEFPVTLQIGGSPWRTWTTKTIPPEWAGEWQVQIRDAAGNLMDELSFTVGTG